MWEYVSLFVVVVLVSSLVLIGVGIKRYMKSAEKREYHLQREIEYLRAENDKANDRIKGLQKKVVEADVRFCESHDALRGASEQLFYSILDGVFEDRSMNGREATCTGECGPGCEECMWGHWVYEGPRDHMFKIVEAWLREWHEELVD